MKRFSCGHSFLLGVVKPVGLSSHDVVARVRRSVGESKVGHAGTLDPLASGVLVCGIGQATRLLGLITLDDKRYRAAIAFGSETSTDDAEGDVVRTAPVDGRFSDAGFARSALSAIVGEQDQVPPSYSAISVDGARAYALARKGSAVELPPRRIIVHEAELVGISREGGSVIWTCDLHVSKGTYVRSLARDLGRSLGCAAHLAGLERTASGSVGMDGCVSLDKLEDGGLDAALPRMLDPLSVLPFRPRHLSMGELDDVRVGRHLRIADGERSELLDGTGVCLVRDGRLWGIWDRQGDELVSRCTFTAGIEGVPADA